MTRLAAFGISVEVPPGWDARVFRHDGGEPTLHLASFGLPTDDGEFGTRATAEMTGDAIFLALTEYRVQPRDLERGIFAKPQPHEVMAAMLSARSLVLPLPGQRGVQRFFSVAARAFCLYIVTAGAGDRDLLRAANRALRSLAVAAPSGRP